MDTHPPTSMRADPSMDAEVVAFLKGRSALCPRCGYDLRDIGTATCPECGEALELKVGSSRPRFGWLVVAMIPGCFSGVAAVFVLVPIVMTVSGWIPWGQGPPWPVMLAELFGCSSAAAVWAMYRHRHRIMHWKTRRQQIFAAIVWGVHMLAFGLFVLAMSFL